MESIISSCVSVWPSSSGTHLPFSNVFLVLLAKLPAFPSYSQFVYGLIRTSCELRSHEIGLERVLWRTAGPLPSGLEPGIWWPTHCFRLWELIGKLCDCIEFRTLNYVFLQISITEKCFDGIFINVSIFLISVFIKCGALDFLGCWDRIFMENCWSLLAEWPRARQGLTHATVLASEAFLPESQVKIICRNITSDSSIVFFR